MSVIYHERTKTFHLTNGQISYLMKVLPNGALGQLYFGKAIRDRDGFDHLLELRQPDEPAARDFDSHVFVLKAE